MVEKLLEQGSIGTVALKNRLIYSSMLLRSSDGQGHFSEAAIRSLEERARHGVGLITVPGLVTRASDSYGLAASLAEDRFVEPLAGIVARLHALGAKTAAQLGARGTRVAAHVESVAPSAIRFAYEERIPRALSVDEIRRIVDDFGQAARRAREAGFDIIEMHACTGKLLSMFMSPYSNRREDEYGGSLENRARFALEALAAIRKGAGENTPVVVRLSVDELLGDIGLQMDEGLAILGMLDRAGADGFHVLWGTQEKIWNISSGYFAATATYADRLGQVRAATQKKLIAMGKLGNPEDAEAVLRSGKADFVALGRPLLVDPLWLEKAQSGQSGRIRRCIGCLNCFTFAARVDIEPKGVSCTVNPAVLRETEYDLPPPTARPQRILVAGGGLAGICAATELARRGHDVTLHEQSGALGGQWLVASHASYKSDYRSLLPMLQRDLEESGAGLRLNSRVDEALLRQARPDRVILATGALPNGLPASVPAPAEGGPALVQGNDIIMGERRHVGQRVVVIGGRYVGMEAALALAEEGRHVSIVEAGEMAHGTSPRLGGVYLTRLSAAGVYFYPGAQLLRLTRDGVNIAFSHALLELPAQTVVLAVGVHPVKELEELLTRLDIPWQAVGDCRKIGDALTAIREGSDMGRQLS